MRYLIDGYNLMHAKGLMKSQFRGDGMHRARVSFLDAVVARIGHLDATKTTVVFDAADPPPNRPRQTSYKGLTLVFSVDEENADAALERLIGLESAPKQLAVVSSDRRVREAARRRGALIIEADAFWAGALRRAEQTSSRTLVRKALQPEPERAPPMDASEAEQFEREFAEADRQLADPLRPGNQTPMFLSDEEIRKLEREIQKELWEP